jgi:hypothetical protein
MTDYVHDGVTTYCWHIPEPTTNTKLNDSNRVDGYSGVDGCPMSMTVELSTSPVEPFQAVNVTWTVSADFNGANEVNMTTVSYGDDSNGDPAQIVHSNIHTCVYGTGCDPFSDGEQLIDKTVNQIANLTDNKATFTATIQFPDTGEYSVLAHIIMPDTNVSERFDYGVYIQLNVQDTTPTPTPTPTPSPTPTPTVTAAPVTSADEESSDSGMSNAAIIGIIVGGVVLVVALGVIAFIFRRRQNQTPAPTNYAYMPPPPYEAVSDIYKEGDRFESEETTQPSMGRSQDAWSGGGAGSYTGGAGSYAGGASAGSQHSSQNLDGTAGSHGSRGSYPQDSRAPPPPQYQGGFRPSDASATSSLQSGSAQRPRRIDSDVEL